ncbi:hypothetical protein K9L67_02110 [Candidatus Woesearchaeota archaeon]|nr:hypothetical protein [Candidatus Woesearchaeota archaeon]MCF7900998.1 hypothetical protein [Candidatus Woesearchaeota archaeon]MCF8013286.1 hypothetical protein [Candidatus Woesearchaeota archaeon]
MKYGKLVDVLLLVSLTAGSMGIVGCMSKEEMLAREKERKEKIERIIQNIYDSSEGVAKYSQPVIQLKAKKSRLSLDIFEHIGDEAKAEKFYIPVSEEFYKKTEIGDVFDTKDNIAGFLFEGEISKYTISVSDKKLNDLYISITGENSWEEISESQFDEILKKDNFAKKFKKQGNLYVADETLKDFFSGTCNIEIESYKSNLTFDIFKHLANASNHMDYVVEVPSFICDKLNVGDTIDKSFVGGSLFFSKSLSVVYLKVKNKF